LKEHKKLVPECLSYHNNIIWSRNGSETARINYIISTLANDSFIELNYKIRNRGDEDWRSIEQKIRLETVQCYFGGKRWYFRCGLTKNLEYCGRRVAVLYEAGDYFGCRHCADLTYDSCQESKRYRSWPWTTFINMRKAEELYGNIHLTHYKGVPTRKYKRYLKLNASEVELLEAEIQILDRLL
jgi:hypothetical protein